MSTGILSETEARGRLAPYHDRLYACVAVAFSRWQRDAASLVQRPDASFRAQAMQQFMVDEARFKFGEFEDVRIIERRSVDRFLLVFPGDIIVQFKKLDNEY